MNIVAFFIEANTGGQVEQIARTFGVDWPHLGAQIISFCIVCFLLYWFAYRPVLNILDQRQRQIARGIADSEKIKIQLTQTEAERHEILMHAGIEAEKVIEEARAAAAEILKNETQKAIAAAAQIVAKAQENAIHERARMFAELKSELGLLVVEATARVTGRVLTAADQWKMAEDTVKQLAKAA